MQQNMRSSLVSKFLSVNALAIAFMILTSCAETPVPPVESALTTCEDPRPQVCTMIYAPVCALRTDGSEETLASACNACADETVISHVDGACEEPMP